MTNRLKQEPSVCLEGSLLVAAPGWENETFGGTVCLVVRHKSDGAVGLVLNRPLKQSADGLWTQLAGKDAQGTARHLGLLHFGGPHSGPVVAVHDREQLAEYTSAEGVYFAAHLDALKELVQTIDEKDQLKIIVGQADWEPMALDREFAEGRWLPLSVSSQIVFSAEDEMWTKAMRQIGNQYIVAITGCHLSPEQLLSN